MDKKLARNLKLRNVNLAPLSPETAERVDRLCMATGASVGAIIDAATQVLEYSLGKEIMLYDESDEIREKIDTYKKYPKISKLNDLKDEESKE